MSFIKRFLIILMCIFYVYNLAAGTENFKYDDIKLKSKISYNPETGTWNKKPSKKSGYLYKTKGFGNFFDYNTKDGEFAFSTDCDYEFIVNGLFVGYSNNDLKFYEIRYDDGKLSKNILTIEELRVILPEYKIVSISEFSPYTNSLKIKKSHGDYKIIVLNDTDNKFNGYKFTSGNAKFEQTAIAGCITVKKAGMIEISAQGDLSKEYPWYVLIIR